MKEHYPELGGNDFSTMTTPSLIVTGTKDFNPYFSEREDWRADAFKLAPAPETLLMLYEAEHLFGGISGYDAKETSDESPALVAAIQRITWAYLRTALYPEDQSWPMVVEELASPPSAAGYIKSK